MSRLVKRYGNRKLYDTSESRYVTLDEIARWVKAGEDVRILENDTGDDLTAVTFAQIILEEERRKSGLLSLPMLREIIQHGEAALQGLAATVDRGMEAIRTGRRQIVFFGRPGSTDPGGNPVEANGEWVPVLVLDDGDPGGSNCLIEGGEDLEGLRPLDGLAWGVSEATGPVPTDAGNGAFAPSPWDGGTFADAVGNPVNWLMFGPDGLPLTFDGTGGVCGALSPAGGGGGALYLTDGERDYAIVLSPIGGVRVHLWNPASGAWTS